MAVKFILVLCASALLVKTISACGCNAINAGVNNVGVVGLAGNGLGWGNNVGLAGSGSYVPIAAGSGGSFPVVSLSPLAPTGLSVLSENAIEGILGVDGILPFVSTVALGGQVPSAGAAGVSYSCGDGSVGIVSEGIAAGAGLAGGYSYGLGNAGLLNAGWAGNGLGGCGCGRLY